MPRCLFGYTCLETGLARMSPGDVISMHRCLLGYTCFETGWLVAKTRRIHILLFINVYVISIGYIGVLKDTTPWILRMQRSHVIFNRFMHIYVYHSEPTRTSIGSGLCDICIHSCRSSPRSIMCDGLLEWLTLGGGSIKKSDLSTCSAERSLGGRIAINTENQFILFVYFLEVGSKKLETEAWLLIRRLPRLFD